MSQTWEQQPQKANPIGADEILILDSETTDNSTKNKRALLSSLPSSGHTIQDEGSDLTQRTNLNFIGTGVIAADDAGNDATTITISSGGDALTANPLSQFALTTSAQLAGVISDGTGESGVVVFNASPVIVTPTIASFVNSTHTHLNAAGGGTITAAAVSDFSTAVAATASVTANTAKVTNANHTGEVTGSTALTITTDAVTTVKILNSNVTLAKIQDIATARFLGRVTAATGVVEELTGTQATTLLDVFTTSLQGLVPASGGSATEFLNGAGAFSVPAGGGGITSINSQTGAAQTLTQQTDKILINSATDDHAFTLGTDVVTIDKANTFEDFVQTFKDNSLHIENPAGTFDVVFQTSAEVTSDRILTIPLLGANRTMVVTGLASQITLGTEVTGAITNLSDVTAKTGTGTTVVFDTSPTIVTPTIASFTNATHDHSNAAGGGTIAIADTTGTLAIARGGTNLTSYVTGDLLFASATDVLSALAKGTANQVLAMDGTATNVVWVTNSAGFADPMTTRGDIIIRNASNITDRLAIGANTFVLTSDGTDISWVAAGAAGEIFTWTADHSMATFKLTATAGNDVILNAPTGQGVSIEVAATDEYLFNATQADYFTNNIVNVGNLTLSKTGDARTMIIQRNEILADDTIIGQVIFQAFDSAPIIETYVRLDAVLESDLLDDEDGSYHIHVADSGTFNVKYMAFNDARSGLIDILKPVNFNSQNVTNMGTLNTHTIPGGTDTFVLLNATQTLASKTLTTPIIGSFTNATHNHQDAAGGGTLLSTAALSDTANIAYLDTGNTFSAGGSRQKIEGTADPTLEISRTSTSATNSILFNTWIKGETTQDMVDGFGTGFSFIIRDSSGTDNPIANFFAIRDGADNSGKVTINTYAGGVSLPALTLRSDKTAEFAGDINIQGNDIINTGTLTLPTATGAILSTGESWTMADGIKALFNPDATNAGINVGENATDPSSPINGDLYYQTSVGLRARIEGAWVTLGTGGGAGSLNDLSDVTITAAAANQILIYNAGATAMENQTMSQDATLAASGALTITNDAVTYAKIQNVVANNVFLGNNSGAGGIVEELTGTEATAMLNVFAASLQGLVPAAGGSPDATKFLNETGVFAVPAASSSGFNETIVRTVDDTTFSDVDLTLDDELFVTLEIGVYAVEARIMCIPGTGPSTFKHNFGGTATFDNSATIITWNGATNQVAGSWTSQRIAGSSGSIQSYTISGTLNVTVAGTFGVQWAQGTTSTNVTTIVKGSRLTVQQTNSGGGGGGGSGSWTDVIPCVLEAPEGVVAYPDIHVLATQVSKISGFVMPTDTDSTINFKVICPEDLAGTPAVVFRVYTLTLSANTTDAVNLTFDARYTGDTENADQTFNQIVVATNYNVSDTIESIDFHDITPTNSPVAGDVITGQLFRDISADAAGDVMIIGISMLIDRSTS